MSSRIIRFDVHDDKIMKIKLFADEDINRNKAQDFLKIELKKT